jgi:hypothetical protein
MSGRLTACFVHLLGVVVVTPVLCAQAEFEMHEWRSTGGHTSQGVFVGLDSEKQTVTLLIPRTLPLSQLAPESQELARRLATQRVRNTPPPPTGNTEEAKIETPNAQSKQAGTPPEARPNQWKWYEGGTLHKATALDWQRASPEDKLATCADFVATLWKNGELKPELQKSIRTIDGLRPLAVALVTFMDKATAQEADPTKNRQLYANQKVPEFAVIGMVMLGWTK